MSQTASWLILMIVGILFIVIGFTGTLGKLFAVAFAPGLLTTKTT